MIGSFLLLHLSPWYFQFFQFEKTKWRKKIWWNPVFRLQSSVISHGNLEFIEIFQIKLKWLPDNCAFIPLLKFYRFLDWWVVNVFDYYDDFHFISLFFSLKLIHLFVRIVELKLFKIFWTYLKYKIFFFSLSFPHSDMSFFQFQNCQRNKINIWIPFFERYNAQDDGIKSC